MFRSLNLIAGFCLLAACTAPDEAAQAGGVHRATAHPDPARAGYYGYGTPASAEQIAGWDIDIRPDGQGLPPGSGSVEDGEMLYDEQCAECHGTFGEGVGRWPVLAGGAGTLTDDRPNRTVGSYWPYTSTLFDYIRRAMPFNRPMSLTDDEVYAITAYVLYLNDLVEDDFVLTDGNLPSVRLPNEPNFVSDPRPDVANVRCMSDCRDPQAIEILSEAGPQSTAAGESLEGGAQTSAAAVPAGRSVYEQYCSICHNIGVGGAPVLGDAGQWQTRLARGLATLQANAISGISTDTGVMPAKGGFAHLRDAEVNDAVNYMVEALQ